MHHQPCVKTIVMKWEIVEHNFSRDWTNNKSPTAVTMITYNVWHFKEILILGRNNKDYRNRLNYSLLYFLNTFSNFSLLYLDY